MHLVYANKLEAKHKGKTHFTNNPTSQTSDKKSPADSHDNASRQCKLTYFIYPFEDEVLCDMAPLSVVDGLFGKPYLWDRHGTYQSRP